MADRSSVAGTSPRSGRIRRLSRWRRPSAGWGTDSNQELFGRPTDLPWGLRIDMHCPRGLADQATYHPTFL